MVGDLQRRLVELRFVDGIEKVEHVPYPTGDQFWVRFNRKLDFRKFEDISKKHGYVMASFASLPSKLPRPIAEIVWNGVSHVITKSMSGWSKFTANLGFEPDGIAKIATDLHGPYQIYISTQEEGIQILYEYLDLKYTQPAPPPKPATPAKPPVAAAVKPSPTALRPAVPVAPITAKPPPPPQSSQSIAPQAAPGKTNEEPKTANQPGPEKKESQPTG